MSMEKDLGTLIRLLNPYTGGSEGSMDLFFGQAAEITNIRVEVQAAYPADWEFKEEQHKVNKAVRVEYRWPVRDKANASIILYWVTDYLLIGFEGSGGA